MNNPITNLTLNLIMMDALLDKDSNNYNNAMLLQEALNRGKTLYNNKAVSLHELIFKLAQVDKALVEAVSPLISVNI